MRHLPSLPLRLGRQIVPRPLGAAVEPVYATNPLDRYLRDVRTVLQHAALSPKVFEVTGRMLLGLEPNAPYF